MLGLRCRLLISRLADQRCSQTSEKTLSGIYIYPLMTLRIIPRQVIAGRTLDLPPSVFSRWILPKSSEDHPSAW